MFVPVGRGSKKVAAILSGQKKVTICILGYAKIFLWGEHILQIGKGQDQCSQSVCIIDDCQDQYICPQ